MKISRVEVDGFGCLCDFRADIAPGLHIFHGPNESGKSTLQQAIFALLYGFYEGDRARAVENATRESFRPWSEAPYRGRLIYELADGRRFRVERDFSTADVPTAVWDLRAGKEITDEFGRGRHGNIPFARRHLGMNRRVFDACAFVSQGELFEVAERARASPQEIGDTIVSLADTARRDVSAQAAINRLDRVLREEVGTPRSRTTPLPLAQRRLEQAKRELEEIERVRSEVSQDAEELERTLAEAEELRREMKRVEYLLRCAEAGDLTDRLHQLSILDEEDSQLRREISEHEAFARWPIEERDTVLGQWTTIEDLRQTISQDASSAEEARRRLGDLGERRDKLSRRQRELAHLRDFAMDRREAIEALVNSWRNAKAIAEQARSRLEQTEVSQAEIEEYRGLKAEVGALSPQQIELLTQRLVAPPPNRLIVLLRDIGRGLARALRWLWRQVVTIVRRFLTRVTHQPENAISEVVETQRPPDIVSEDLRPEEARNVLKKHARYSQLRPGVERFEALLSDVQMAQESLEAVEHDIRGELQNVVEAFEGVEEGWAVYLERVQARQELESVDREIGLIDREASSLHKLVNRLEDAQRRLSTLETGLQGRLREFTGESDSLERLYELYLEGCNRRTRHDSAVGQLKGNAEKRALILKGRSPQEIEGALRRVEAEVERLLKDSPWLQGAETDATIEELGQRRNELSSQLSERESKAEGLRTRIDTKLEGLRSRAEVEEDIRRYELEAARLDQFGGELTVAMEVIEHAMTEAHRDFAPSVGRFLSRGLAHITGGRYTKVLLDPSTLRLTTEVPETRRLEDVEALSRGTRAAAYLLLRVGLAQHMSSMGEPVPLILDDPLVDLDDVRLENFLELIAELASEVQILLFTKDADTRTWFTRHCAGSPDHSLTSLTLPTGDH